MKNTEPLLVTINYRGRASAAVYYSDVSGAGQMLQIARELCAHLNYCSIHPVRPLLNYAIKHGGGAYPHFQNQEYLKLNYRDIELPDIRSVWQYCPLVIADPCLIRAFENKRMFRIELDMDAASANLEVYAFDLKELQQDFGLDSGSDQLACANIAPFDFRNPIDFDDLDALDGLPCSVTDFWKSPDDDVYFRYNL